MGSCFSKKCSATASRRPPASTAAEAAPPPPPCAAKPNEETQVKNKKKLPVEGGQTKKEEERVMKEVFVIKHRKSQSQDGADRTSSGIVGGNTSLTSSSEAGEGSVDAAGLSGVTASNCTKEEVDAILIQCGRLSRSSSGNLIGSAGSGGGGRRYSGSKRSYDFDHHGRDNPNDETDEINGNGDDGNLRHSRQRDHRRSRSSSHGRRRTPSRERDQQQQRSSSRDRAGGACAAASSGRRVSRSPGRRSETPPVNAEKSTAQGSASVAKPGKMVSVPASVSAAAAADKENATCIRRVLVRRNASPRSQSPVNPNPNPSLSRSSSRKAEQSPYRRNPLSEIDNNALPQAPPNHPAAKTGAAAVKLQGNRTRDCGGEGATAAKESAPTKQNLDTSNGIVVQRTNNERAPESNVHEEPTTEPISKTSNVELTTMASDTAKPQLPVRSRSSRRSRDLDFNPEALLNPSTSYNTLLLADIQNFHQKKTVTTVATPSGVDGDGGGPSFPIPACLTKACSILEAVSDLNSSNTSSGFCPPFSGDWRSPGAADSSNVNEVVGGKRRLLAAKEPDLESMSVADDGDLMAPSFHKYVTVRRGQRIGNEDDDDIEEQESSGSNSFVSGSQQHNWLSSLSSGSGWELNSAESTDRCTSSRSYSKDLPAMVARKKRDPDHHHHHQGSKVVGGSRDGSSAGRAATVSAATT